MAGLNYNKSNNKSNNKNGGCNRGNNSFRSNNDYKGKYKGDDKKVNINFINPYNFVPLGKNVSKFQDSKDEKKLSGVINYSLMTKTPLFIPNTSNDYAIIPPNDQNHKSYEFFAYEDLSKMKNPKKEDELKAPVIPGSEIRGLIRNNYEVFTNSCISAIDTSKKLYRRSSLQFNSGLIKRIVKDNKVSYELYPTKKIKLRKEKENNEYKDGEKIYFTVEKASKICEKAKDISRKNIYSRIGFIIKGNPIEENQIDNRKKKKNGYHIFELTSNKCVHKSINLEDLRDAIKVYQDINGKEKYKAYNQALNDFEQGKAEEYFPVYYRKLNNNIMLSPACITREIYKKSIDEVIGDYKPCDNKKKLCKACNMFGTLNKALTVTSKVRMSDMSVNIENGVEVKDLYLKSCTLKVLASPCLSSVEFYLKRPNNAMFWTYDYYKAEDGIKVEAATINGRKFYWHNLKSDYIDRGKKTNLNISVRPIKENTIFTGKIYFEGITEEELNTLIYIINAGDNQKLKDKSHGYKLGIGKPLGLGSVAMEVDKVTIHSVELDVDNEDLINRESDFIAKTPIIEEEIKEQLEIVTNFKNKDIDNMKVDYPRTENDNEIFKWFAQNHSANKDVIQAYMKPLTPKLVMVENNK